MSARGRDLVRARPRRLVAVFALVTLGPLLVLTVSAIKLSSDAAHRQVEREMNAAADASAVAVEQELIGLADVVNAFAKRPTLVSSFGDGDSATLDLDTIQFHLAALADARSGVQLAFVTDPNGVLVDVFPSTPSIVGQGFSFRDWYRGVIATDGPYVSEVYRTAATGNPLVVTAAAPIHDPARPGSPLVGVIAAGYRLDAIQHFVDDYASAQGVELTVTDQRGVVVAAPGAPLNEVVSRAKEAGVSAALRGGSGSGVIRRPTGEVVAAHAPLPRLGWTISAEIPATKAFRELAGLRATITGVATLLALVLVSGLVFLGRTLRRQAATEDDLRSSESFLSSLVENIPHMVFVKDASDLRYLRLNRAGEDLLGYTRHELVGRHISEVLPASEAEVLTAQDREVLDGRHDLEIPAETVETRYRGTRILHTRKIPIPGSDGRPQYLLGISEDITERHEANAALEHARLEAQRANQAKSEFLSRMSHELRTPLNSVLGFGQLLQLDHLDGEQRDSVDQITKAGRHLLGLIDEVLDLSRVEAGELRLSLEPVELCEVVDEAMGMVAPLAAARGVTMDRTSSAHPVFVHSDRQRLTQVVVNLLANAVKYNRDYGEVHLGCEPTDDGRLRLTVEDTGIGIAATDVDRLFAPFERLGAAGSGVEGTGLGLTLTKQLVEAMGGAIGVHSEIGVGSRFWVDLPPADTPGEEEERAIAEPAPIAPKAGVRTVLYVEDNLSNVKLVERVVARRPEVTLVVAMQGSIALELAREHRPHLILLDLHLPDISGEEVLRRLRTDARTADTPIVVLSADATPGQVQRLLAYGATDYLTKPFDIPRFLELLDANGSAEHPGADVYPSSEPSEAAATTDPAANESGGGPLDPRVMASLHELRRASPAGTAGISDLIATFLTDTEARVAQLRAAVAAGDGDAEAVRGLAHSLAGSSASLGAGQVAQVCRAIEARCIAGELDEVPALAARLVEEFAAARVALRSEFLDDDGEHT